MLIINLLFIYLSSIIGCFYIGHLIRQFVSDCEKETYDNFNDFFKNTLFGVICFVSIFSMIWSHLKTINSLIILLVIIYFLFSKHKFKRRLNFSFTFDLKLLSFVLVISLVVFFYWVSLFFDFNTLQVRMTHPDLHFYSEIARGLAKTGVENRHNRVFDFYVPTYNSLYHYFDYWWNAFLSKLTSHNTYDIQLFIVYPFFYLLTFFGIASLLELRMMKRWKLIALTLLSLFSYSLFFLGHFQLELLDFWGFGLMPSSIHSLKLICIYPFILISTRYLFEKNYIECLLFLLMSVVIYNTLIVTVLSGVFCGLGYLFFNRKTLDIPFKFLFGIYAIFIISFLIYVYFVANTNGENDYEIVHVHSIKLLIILFMEYFVKNSIGYLLCFIFYFVVLFSNLKNTRLVFFTIVYFSSFFTSFFVVSLFHGTENFPQMINNLIGPFCLLLFIVSFLFISKSIKKWTLLFTVIGFFNFFYILKENNIELSNRKQFSSQYINFVKKTFKTNSRYVVYNPLNNYWFNYDVAEFTSRFTNISSGFNIHIKKQYKYKTKSPFELWCVRSRCKMNYENLLKYVRIMKIKYMFIPQHVLLPSIILKNVKLIYEDKLSKEKMFEFL